MARVSCLFCGRSDLPMTREHVFARWLTQRVGSAGSARVIATVCAQCNAGWMSALEVGFRRLLTGARTGVIPAPDRTTLSRWFTKTAVLIAHARGAALVDAKALVTAMPAGVEVFVARRRRAETKLEYVLDADADRARHVAVLVDDLVGHVAIAGVLTSRHGTRLWPLRSHALRWDTLPVITPVT